jgi:hypothetical protein
MRRENAQISKVRNEKEKITTNARKSRENLYSNKLENLEEISQYL